MILLDTHALIWLAEGDPQLGDRARQLADAALTRDALGVSVITFWETAMKFATTIDRTTEVSKAQRTGTTLFQTNPMHKVTEQYRQLAREVEVRLRKFEGH